MYHYIAFAWNIDDAHANRTALNLSKRLSEHHNDWSRTFKTEGMSVYSSRPSGRALLPYILPRERGAILGRIFSKNHGNSPISQFEEHNAASIARSGGRTLVEEYWGNYVAFLSDHQSRRLHVIRDCSGKIPCYRTTFENVEIIFADIADLSGLDLPTFTLNRQYLAAFIYSTELQVRDSGLNEVTELLAGETLEIGQHGVRQFPLWDPVNICKLPSIENYDGAVKELRAVTQHCVDAWSTTYDQIMLGLSGGLDSAIVLGTLTRSPIVPAITCLNLFGENPLEDERTYARLAANQAGVRLIEQPLSASLLEFDERQFGTPAAVRPSLGPLFGVLNQEAINQIASAVKAEAMWTGQGGDHLFLQFRSALSAVDHLRRYGISSGTAAAIADAARFSCESYLSVFRTASRLARGTARWTPMHSSQPEIYFVNRDALPEKPDEYIATPWSVGAEVLPPGKQSQIWNLAEVLNRHRPLPGYQYTYDHHPLLSQPLIELCLRIPTYLLVRGGRQRALAREAFSDRVPTEILMRETKGGVNFTVTDTIRRSEMFLRDLLLNGNLVRDRIISRQELEPYLLHKAPLRTMSCRALLGCIAAEIWTRIWSKTALRVAA